MKEQQITEEQHLYIAIYIRGLSYPFTSKIKKSRLFNEQLPQPESVFHRDYWNPEGFGKWCLSHNVKPSSQRVCYVEFVNSNNAIIHLEMYEYGL